jgi:hypothetical protein
MTHWTLLTDAREKYQAYLCSEEWGRLRLAVRIRCHGRCERCHVRPMEHTHHRTYARRFQEDLTDLVGLCDPCHNAIHGWQSKRTLTAEDRIQLIKAMEAAMSRAAKLTAAMAQVEPIVSPVSDSGRKAIGYTDQPTRKGE